MLRATSSKMDMSRLKAAIYGEKIRPVRTGFWFNGVIVRPERACEAKYKCSTSFPDGLSDLDRQNERR